MANGAGSGADLTGWRPPRAPDLGLMTGRCVRLERLSAARHGADLHAVNGGDARLWDYMPYGPFASSADYCRWAEGTEALGDPFFYAIIDPVRGKALGVAAYLRVTPAHGTIEVGHICLSPALQGTRAATEALFLMADWAFAAGYRRYEWKCNAANMASRRAAERLGFSYEGTFRNHMVQKGRNRDTAWFAITGQDWQALRPACQAWLDPANFDGDGRQRQSLSKATHRLLVSRDPLLGGAPGR